MSLGLACPLTVVTGPAGSGKTALVRELARLRNTTTVWVPVRAHRHAVGVAGQLVRRLLDRLGSLPTDLLTAVGTSCGPTIHADPLGRAEQLGALVASALEDTLDRDLVIVLDNLDELDVGSEPSRFVEALVRNRPSRVQLVLCSRRPLGFSIERLQAAGDVQQLGNADLRLDDESASRQITDRYGDDLDDDVRASIITASAGLPGRVLSFASLASFVMEHAPEQRVQAVERVAATSDPLLAAIDDIIEHLADDTRLVLDDVVVCDGATPETLRRLAHPHPAEDLRRLTTAGIVEPPSDPNGRFHASRVVRDLVSSHQSHRDRLRPRAAAASRAAIEQGDARRALAAAQHGGDDLVASVLEAVGPAVLERGDAQLVIEAAASLADDRRPAFLGLVGQAHQALGDWSRALGCFEKAMAHDPQPAIAWRLGLVHYLQGDVEAARAVYRRALDGDSRASAARDTDATDGDGDADLATLLGYTSAAAWLAGELEEARDLARRSLALATTIGADAALAVAHTGAAMVAASDGDRVGNEWHYGRALQHAERAGDTLQLARIRSNRGSRQMEEGDFAGALDELDRAVRAADLGSYGTFLALALSNRGEVLTKIGRLDDARTDLTTSAGLLQGQGSRMVGYPLIGLARLHLLRGDVEQALGACERATASAIGHSDRQFDIAVRTQLARALAHRDLEAGWQEITAAAENATGSLDEPELWTVIADLALQRGDRGTAADAARKASRMARGRLDRYALGAAIEVTALTAPDDGTRRDLLDESFTIFDEIGCVLDAARVDLRRAAFDTAERGAARAQSALACAQRLGARPLARAAEAFLRQSVAVAEPPLVVAVLGSFSVRRDGHDIATTAWQSKKARDLFKMLVVRAGRSVPRELAMDRLWPGEPPAKVSNRLSAALATVRGVLDPEKRHESDRFVRSEGDAISVDADAIDLDVSRFLETAAAALAAHRNADGMAGSMLVAAESMYAGDVLEDDPYDDWYVPLREEARATYLAVVRALAQRRVDEGDTDDAIRLLLRMIEREPYDEVAHLDLITQLSRAGRHGDARRRHQYYVDRMRELDVEPRSFPT